MFDEVGNSKRFESSSKYDINWNFRLLESSEKQQLENWNKCSFVLFFDGNFFHNKTNTSHIGGRMNQTQFVGHNCAMSCIHSCFLSFRLLKLVTQSHCTNTVLFRETLVMEIGHCLKILLRVENEGRNWFSYHVCRICKLVSMGDGHKRQYVRIAWLLGLIWQKQSLNSATNKSWITVQIHQQTTALEVRAVERVII